MGRTWTGDSWHAAIEIVAIKKLRPELPRGMYGQFLEREFEVWSPKRIPCLALNEPCRHDWAL